MPGTGWALPREVGERERERPEASQPASGCCLSLCVCLCLLRAQGDGRAPPLWPWPWAALIAPPALGSSFTSRTVIDYRGVWRAMGWRSGLARDPSAASHRLVALGVQPDDCGRIYEGDVREFGAESWAEALAGVDVVVCVLRGLPGEVLPLQRIVLEHAIAHQVPRLVAADFLPDYTGLPGQPKLAHDDPGGGGGGGGESSWAAAASEGPAPRSARVRVATPSAAAAAASACCCLLLL
eukprot:COSAG01_NODE_122_length_25212_cov_25.945646_18_plen_239_part_00